VPKFLNDGAFQTLEATVLDWLSVMDEAGVAGDDHRRIAMEAAYNNFDNGSNTGETMVALRAAAALYNPGWVAQLDAFLVGAVRTSNYPTSFDQGARDALTAYRADPANQGMGGQVRCAGHNKPAHMVVALTIDHVVPVATHWNNTGYNTTKAARRTWYNDPTNHVYLCQPCNSSKGSGGVYYRIDTGPHYTNL
jgi:hypothetical protein